MNMRTHPNVVRTAAGAFVLAGLAFLPTPAVAQAHGGGGGPGLAPPFVTSDRCIACHKGVTTRAGDDVSIGFDWRASMMANAARDPYWQAAVRREIMDHPGAREAIEDKCATCHMPMESAVAHMAGGTAGVFRHLPPDGRGGPVPPLVADGVGCTLCHQITAEGLGTEESFTGGFRVAEGGAGPRSIYGPFTVDAGRTTLMRSATGFEPVRSDHVQSSELCATCHTLYTHALDEQGREVGELPEQVPYLEWRHSAYPDEGRSCQSCHMPVVTEEVPVTGVLGVPRAEVSRHVFRGGNFFMLGMLNRYRDELGVTALPQELDAAVRRTREHLGAKAATVEVEASFPSDDRLVVEVVVANLGGHKLPTAYPSRRAWLHATVRDAAGRTVFESGAVTAEGRIVGNDNDDDPARFEPHHREITSPDQVQIYEAIMEDVDGRVTTGLIRAVRYAKDNRVTPRGFPKGAADPDVAVLGGAVGDADFDDGGDRVRYVVPVDPSAGPFSVEVDFLYQPIGFRWARNLEAYDAVETRRFVGWYDEMASGSWALLARGSATAGSPGEAAGDGAAR